MIDTIALKQIITDMATSGKLSVCDSNDESIETLIRRLPEASKKRKRLLAQKFDYDELYDIPEHWRWMKLGKISSYGDTLTKVTPSEATGNTWILELEDIETGGKLLGKKYVCDKTFIGEKTAFKKNQVLYSKLRPYLKKVLVADENGISTPELIASDIYAGIEPEYIVLCLTNSYVDRVINRRSYGVKMPRVDAGFMVNLPIPIPPIQEQQRIVGIVKMAFEQVDTIATLQSAYSSDLEILKSKIIDAGIQGKLTEQLPEDGNAEDLYDAIQEEKQKLIKEKKIKKAKALPKITEDEIPFEIPENWKWVKVGDIAYLTSGKPYEETTDGELYVKVSDMNLPENEVIIKTSQHFTSKDNSGEIQQYSIIFPKRGGAIATNKKRMVIEKPIFVDLNTMGLTVINEDIFYYVKLWFDSLKLDELQTGTAIPQINNNDIYPLPIPLPPLAEQKRIVEKVNSILDVI